MKQVIIEEKKQTVSINNLNESKLYAVKKADSFYCGIVHKNHFPEIGYEVHFLCDSYTWGSGAKTFRECIHIAISGNYNAYEFDNLKEFAEWLVRETK